ATSNGTGIAGTNYTTTTGTLSFAAGVTTQTITVPTIDDHLYSGSLGITVTLLSPSSGAVLNTGSATGTIVNIDGQPSLSI
ncbi:Calx-beta domain-containing protein, partial [Klebsiella pneumoniae]|uniref:Calx-beta domain-containing protein n=1 Tax=Klebsiella pneumoniae TaxID=573 RepID=UPI003A83C228